MQCDDDRSSQRRSISELDRLVCRPTADSISRGRNARPQPTAFVSRSNPAAAAAAGT
jgi:hypothetical protein